MAMRKVRRGDGVGRTFWVHVPAGLSGPAPLLMMLHGGRQSARGFAAITRMNELADRDGFIVIYPQQSRRANPGRYWRWFSPRQARRDVGEAAILRSLVDRVGHDHLIAPGRVAVAGLSAGGAMAAALAVAYPEVFGVAGVHSGLPYGVARNPATALRAMHRAPVPRTLAGVHKVLVIHGDEDHMVDVTNASRFHHQLTPGVVPTETMIDPQDPGTHPATLTTTSRDDSLVEVWRIHGLGHAWSGGAPGRFSTPEGPSASELVVDFARRVWGG